ncbi:16 kDa beta-galactoside-binding lectin-like [Pseudonaja textilis]|uniref:16 kDa beta-galactoside-binding lectin-like n=1 Tax=Pseudonaja textilis TaxID=8673 RepID=UPI000EAA5B32|nr:16 kDa beta-galactoside-binding lectin-like [Pseudonaja textilis]
MEPKLVAHVKIRSGNCIKVKAKVDIDAKSFAINLGQNESELVLHFNPRFDSRGDIKTIICNSKTCGEWGTETRKSIFPFQQGEEFKLFVCYDAEQILVKMQKGEELVFPNRLQMDTVEYFSIDGDVKIKSVRFD